MICRSWSSCVGLAVSLALIATHPLAAQAPELVDIGGRTLEVLRVGSGGPSVVFEAGITDLRLWSPVQTRIAAFASTLSYSHAGIGASDREPGPRAPARVVQDLHELLGRSGLAPPYVLVGHSMGGLYARLYAMTYPADVAGLVLVDGAHERQVREFAKLDSSFLKLRETSLRSLESGPRGEMEGLGPVLSAGSLGVATKLPDVPMVVLTSTRSTPPTIPGAGAVWRDLHTELFRSTTYGMHIITSKSGHLIQRDEPDLVVNAVHWVIEAARGRK